MNSKSTFLANLELMLETEKFEKVLEYAYNAEDRDLDLYETLTFILERKTPYYKRKMINNFMTEPYSKWFEALFAYEKNWELNKFYSSKNPILDEDERLEIFLDRFRDVVHKKYSVSKFESFIVNLALNDHKDESKLNAIYPYSYPMFGMKSKKSIVSRITRTLINQGEYSEAFWLIDDNVSLWDFDSMITIEAMIDKNWKKILLCLEDLPKHFSNIILKIYLQESLDQIFVLSKENDIAKKYLWNAIGENLLRLKGDYNEMKKAVDWIKTEGYTLSEIYTNAFDYISKRMTNQICYDKEDNMNYQDYIDYSMHWWRFGVDYDYPYNLPSDYKYALTCKILKKVCESN